MDSYFLYSNTPLAKVQRHQGTNEVDGLREVSLHTKKSKSSDTIVSHMDRISSVYTIIPDI